MTFFEASAFHFMSNEQLYRHRLRHIIYYPTAEEGNITLYANSLAVAVAQTAGDGF